MWDTDGAAGAIIELLAGTEQHCHFIQKKNRISSQS